MKPFCYVCGATPTTNPWFLVTITLDEVSFEACVPCSKKPPIVAGLTIGKPRAVYGGTKRR